MSWERKKEAFLLRPGQHLANTVDEVPLKTLICTKEGRAPFLKTAQNKKNLEHLNKKCVKLMERKLQNSTETQKRVLENVIGRVVLVPGWEDWTG